MAHRLSLFNLLTSIDNGCNERPVALACIPFKIFIIERNDQRYGMSIPNEQDLLRWPSPSVFSMGDDPVTVTVFMELLRV